MATAKTKEPTDPDARTGGVTDKEVAGTVFSTSGSEPVRDKTVDESKGTPVTRYFTKDGTPVEPSTVPPAVTPANLSGFDHTKRDDIVAAVEYIDESGATVTHDSLKAAKEAEKS
jgi:hypothetical protein